MSIKGDVNVKISLLRPTPKTGLGRPLIIGPATTATAFKVYADLEAVLADFPTSTEIYKAAYALFNQGDNSPSSIATLQYVTDADLQTEMFKILANDWYYLVSTERTAAKIKTIADAIELDGSRMLFVSLSSDADVATLKAQNYERVVIFQHEDTANYPEAAWIGRAGSAEAGSLTWKFKGLRGIQPMAIDTTRMNAIHAAGANTYVVKSGDAQTSEGKTVSGEYIDVVQSKDWITLNIELGIQKLFFRNEKLPFDSRGIGQMEGVVKEVLLRAFNNGMIAVDDEGQPMYSTNFARASEVDAADREQRHYTGGRFRFRLAGAIHTADVEGEIEI